MVHELRVGVNLLLGEYCFNLDTKGRLCVPSEFRKVFSDGLIATRGFDNCVSIYTKADWPEFANKLRKMTSLKKNVRLLNRYVLSGAKSDEMDKQGRITIPTNLRDWASLKKEVVIIGVGDHLEVWSKDQWLKTEKEAAKSFSDIAEELSDFEF